MSKSMNSKALTAAVLNAAEKVLSKITGITPSEPAQVKELEIVDYDDRMRVAGVEKFNSPTFLAVSNFYLNAADLGRRKAKGSLVVYVDTETAGKLFSSLGFKVPDDEDDMSMMTTCGELCALIGSALKAELKSKGYTDLVVSTPQNYKNSVIQGVDYNKDANVKHEFSFFYWRRKVLVLEVTMADIPTGK